MQKIKLYDLLKILDPLSSISVIYVENTEDDSEFMGCAMDCPFWLSDLFLCRGLEDDGFALSVRGSDKESSGVLVISVTDNEDKAIEQ